MIQRTCIFPHVRFLVYYDFFCLFIILLPVRLSIYDRGNFNFSVRVLLPNLVFTPDFTPYFGCGLYENAGSTTRYTVFILKYTVSLLLLARLNPCMLIFLDIPFIIFSCANLAPPTYISWSFDFVIFYVTFVTKLLHNTSAIHNCNHENYLIQLAYHTSICL